MSWLTIPRVFDRGLRSPSGPINAFVRHCLDKQQYHQNHVCINILVKCTFQIQFGRVEKHGCVNHRNSLKILKILLRLEAPHDDCSLSACSRTSFCTAVSSSMLKAWQPCLIQSEGRRHSGNKVDQLLQKRKSCYYDLKKKIFILKQRHKTRIPRKFSKFQYNLTLEALEAFHGYDKHPIY
ncbi:Aryl Hydrocarbon Receptor Nuclear Translocator-Like Protein 1 [Manis pentadactyla]|nr:Aryl Hydrocarbon Receptor Nuclear Translocator-Like Protein 1 [Manis pentadactyla]